MVNENGMVEYWSAGKSPQYAGAPVPIITAIQRFTPHDSTTPTLQSAASPRVFRLAPPVGYAGSDQSKKPVFQLIPGYSSLCPRGEGVSDGEFYTALSHDTHRTIILPRPATNAAPEARGISSRLVVSPIANRKSKIRNSSGPAIVAF